MENLQSLPLRGGPVSFEGAVSLAPVAGGLQPWRLPFDELDMYHPRLRSRAVMPTGVRVCLISDTRQLVISASSPPFEDPQTDPTPATWQFDLLVDGRLHQRRELPCEPGRVIFDNIPAGEHRLEVYLPLVAPTVVHEVLIDRTAAVRLWHDPRPRWTVYGSSLTQARAAAGPSETWPAIVANQFGLNLTALGYGGNDHLEAMVARMIRDLPADYISLCTGVNIVCHATLSDRLFRSAVIGFVKIIREKHPHTPILFTSAINVPKVEPTTNAVGMSMALTRQEIQTAVQILQRHGDEHIHYQDGVALWGPRDVRHQPDEVHPNAEGYRLLAQRYAELAMPKLGLTGSNETAKAR